MPKKSNYKPDSHPKPRHFERSRGTSHPKAGRSILLRLEEALTKAQSFCAYQERSIFEVKEKLLKLKVSPTDISRILTSLQQDNFINEERFANSFVNGKFCNNKWGKIKIRYELIKKHLPETIITSALSNINDEEYYNTLLDIISKKTKGLNKPLSEQNKNRIFRFALSRGFEPDLISKILGTED